MAQYLYFIFTAIKAPWYRILALLDDIGCDIGVPDIPDRARIEAKYRRYCNLFETKTSLEAWLEAAAAKTIATPLRRFDESAVQDEQLCAKCRSAKEQPETPPGTTGTKTIFVEKS